MQQLADENKKLIESLKAVTQDQRNAIVTMLTITRAAAVYEARLTKTDSPALQSY